MTNKKAKIHITKSQFDIFWEDVFGDDWYIDDDYFEDEIGEDELIDIDQIAITWQGDGEIKIKPPIRKVDIDSFNSLIASDVYRRWIASQTHEVIVVKFDVPKDGVEDFKKSIREMVLNLGDSYKCKIS